MIKLNEIRFSKKELKYYTLKIVVNMSHVMYMRSSVISCSAPSKIDSLVYGDNIPDHRYKTSGGNTMHDAFLGFRKRTRSKRNYGRNNAIIEEGFIDGKILNLMKEGLNYPSFCPVVGRVGT